MTEYHEIDAMLYLQTMLSSSLDPTPQKAPTGVYVYPADYEEYIAGGLTLPVVIISQKVGVINPWIMKSQEHVKPEAISTIGNHRSIQKQDQDTPEPKKKKSSWV